MAQRGAAGAPRNREGEGLRRPCRGAGVLRLARLLVPCAGLGLLASVLTQLPLAPCWGLGLLFLLRR